MKLTLVYMVAGLSSRFNNKMKWLIPVTEKETLIEYSANQALPYISQIIFIVSEKTGSAFKEKFHDRYKGIPVYYALQNFDKEKRDRPWGTVDALCSAMHLINEPLIVCNGDDIYGQQAFKLLSEFLKNDEENATIGYYLKNVLPEKGKVNRGIFQVNNDYVKNIIEIFDIENSNIKEKNLHENSLVSMNIFALQLEVLKKLQKMLIIFKERNKNDRKIECLLPNELSNLIRKNEIKMKIFPTNEKCFGITNPGDEEIVRRELKGKVYKEK